MHIQSVHLAFFANCDDCEKQMSSTRNNTKKYVRKSKCRSSPANEDVLQNVLKSKRKENGMERFKFTEALVKQPATMLKEGQKEICARRSQRNAMARLKKSETSPLTPKRSAMGPIFSGRKPPSVSMIATFPCPPPMLLGNMAVTQVVFGLFIGTQKRLVALHSALVQGLCM
jgi:hypothetical protein